MNRKIRSEKISFTELAETNFSSFISSGGWLRKIGLRILFNIGKLPLSSKLPLIGGLSQSAIGLAFGFISEKRVLGISKTTPENTSENSFNRVTAISSNYDYIIIGSGPGAVAACSNLPTNASILVIEKGVEARTQAKFHHTLLHVARDFEKAGQELIVSRSLAQFAQARVFGGGSEVNSGLYHRLPQVKKTNFLTALHIDNSDWESSESWVEKLLNIQRSEQMQKNSLIVRGAEALGLEYQNIPRWREYRSDGTFTHFGMVQSFWKNFQNTFTSGHLRLGQEVKFIKQEGNLIEVHCRDYENNDHSYSAKHLIIAAGAIGTPKLLADSGFIDWSDTRFQWHPMYRATVLTKEADLGFGDIDPFQAWTKDFSLKFGSAVSTPGLLAVNLNRVITEHDYRHLRSYYVSHTSSGRGGLLPKTAIPWYKFSENDLKLRESGTALLEQLISGGGGVFASEHTKVKKAPSTVHIFGTLPNTSKIYIPGTVQLASAPNIYVCDGSILPEGPGVNPQGVIMSAVKSKNLSLGN